MIKCKRFFLIVDQLTIIILVYTYTRKDLKQQGNCYEVSAVRNDKTEDCCLFCNRPLVNNKVALCVAHCQILFAQPAFEYPTYSDTPILLILINRFCLSLKSHSLVILCCFSRDFYQMAE